MEKFEYPFSITILPPEEGGGYLIEFPDLPGCISDGETIDEAIANGKDALFCWIETAKQYGDEIPQLHSPTRSSDGNEQEENPSDVDLRNIIHQNESVSIVLPPTWQFDWLVTYS